MLRLPLITLANFYRVTPTSEDGNNGRDGIVTGGVLYSGGPASGMRTTRNYQPGLVEIARGSDVVARQHVAEGQAYRFILPEGDYTLRVWLGEGLRAWPIKVKAGKVTEQDAPCAIR